MLGTGLLGLPIGFKTGACVSEESFLVLGCKRKKLTFPSMNAFVRLAWCPSKICRLGIRWTSENPHHVHWRHHRSDGRLLFCAAELFRKAPGFASQRSRGGGSKQEEMNPTEHLRCALRSPGLSIKYSCKLRDPCCLRSVLPCHSTVLHAMRSLFPAFMVHLRHLYTPCLLVSARIQHILLHKRPSCNLPLEAADDAGASMCAG